MWFNMKHFWLKNKPVQNLIVERPGTAPEVVVIGAHYDTALLTPGADDNGSGVASALALAQVFAKSTPKNTLRFVFFTNEEPPFFNTKIWAVKSMLKRPKPGEIKWWP